MIKTIEIKLIDEDGSYSVAYVDYEGYVDMLIDHNIDMVYDALQSMTDSYTKTGKLEILRTKKDPIAEHEKYRAPHKH